MNELISKNSLPVQSIGDLQTIGKLFEQSGMFGCSQQGQGLVLAMTCVMQKMTPIEVIETYHLIDGRPSKRADAMLAALIELGGSYKIIERTPECAKIQLKYKDAEYTSSFTWKEAKEEPYVYQKDKKTFKKNWATPRARMQCLWARVVSDGVRVVCPLANRGNYTPEEIQDFDENSSIDLNITTTSTPSIIDISDIDNENTLNDFNLIPIGPNKGKPWSSLKNSALEKALAANHESITEDHKKVIQNEIEKRKAVNHE